MQFHIDDEGASIYQQLIRQVKLAIAGGRLIPGNYLPSVREVADNLNLNPMTVSRAYKELRSQGLVEEGAERRLVVSPQIRPATVEEKREILKPQLIEVVLAARVLGLSARDISALIQAEFK